LWSLSLTFPNKYPVCTCHLPYSCHMPHPSNSSWFDRPDKIDKQ
jgi:hypothetical protein